MEFTYPQGLKKALTFSYDDGREFDRRLVEIFNQHGLKGTFHLNSGTLGLHAPNGDFVAPGEVKELYQGHEVAVHTVSHLHPMSSPLSQVSREIAEDRKALEALTGGLVVGMSYPYGCYSDEVVAVAKAQGILYSRTTVATGEFHLPADFLRWHSTCHHGDPRLLDLGKKFLAAPDMGLSLMYVWGHSFEFAWGGQLAYHRGLRRADGRPGPRVVLHQHPAVPVRLGHPGSGALRRRQAGLQPHRRDLVV